MKWKPNPANITFRVGLDELPSGAFLRAEELGIKADEQFWSVEQSESGGRWMIWTDVDDEPVLVSVYVDDSQPADTEEGARGRYRYLMALVKGRGK